MALAQASTMANSTRTQLSTDSLSLFPDNTSQLITPADLRDWITSGIESFVTQKDKSTFENAFYECQSSPITATSGTTNLALATGNFVHITGSGSISITSFGTLPAGSRFVLCFDIAVTLVYNATTMILPGAANIVTAPGDSVMIISEGGGNWRLIGYFPSSGLPVGTVTAVTATTPLSSTGSNAPNLSISQAGASTDGYLSSTDWNTFNNKGNGTVTSVSVNAPLADSGTSTAPNLSIPQANGSTDGFLDSADWSTFNSKQPAGNYITGLTGDVTASGPGSVAATIANDAVTTSKILNNNVTYGKIQNASGSSLLLGSNASGTGITEITLGSNLTMSGNTLNATGGGGGGTPGGADTQIQYNNGGAFGGVSDLTWDDINNVLTINTPRIGQSNGNGHFHIHSATSVPAGITDYLTIFWQKATRVLGFRNENESFRTFFQLLQPTADRTYTFPDSDGNVVLDTLSQTLSNKTLASPEVSGIANFKNGTSPGQIRLFEGSGSGTNYTGFISPATLASNLPLTLPSDSGTSGYVLQTDGSGNLSWVNNGGTVYGSFILNTTETSITGTVAETINKTILIPANTFTVQAGARIIARLRRSDPGFNIYTVRVYINTSPSTLTGATLIGSTQWSASGGITGAKFERSIIIISPTTSTSFNLITANNTFTDATAAGVFSTAAIDWSQNQYVIVTTQSSNVAYTNYVRSIQIVPE